MSNTPYLTTDKQPAIDAAKERIEETGQLTPFDIARIATKTHRTFYLTCCILEEESLLPQGTYDRHPPQHLVNRHRYGNRPQLRNDQF